MSNEQPVSNDTPGVILARILKIIMRDLGITIDRYQYFMYNFIRQLEFNNNYKISSLINNISKEIFSSSISWKVFIKALIFLGTSRLIIFLQVDQDAPMVQHELDLSNKELTKNLFCFSDKEETQGEVQLGKHLKVFLDQVLVKNSLTEVYSAAIDQYISKLRDSKKHINKSLKGNLTKELKLENISWKVFIKTLTIYRLVNPVIGVSVYDRTGKRHTVSFNVNLNDLVV